MMYRLVLAFLYTCAIVFGVAALFVIIGFMAKTLGDIAFIAIWAFCGLWGIVFALMTIGDL